MSEKGKDPRTDHAGRTDHDDPFSAPHERIIAKRLKEARAALRMTQRALAEAAGMPLPSHKDYEGGKRIPGGEALAGYARAGVNVTWLLTGEGASLAHDQAAEDRAAYGQSSAAGGTLDTATLVLAVEAVEEGLSATGRVMAPRQKGELVAAVYELLAASEQKEASRGQVLRLIRSVA